MIKNKLKALRERHGRGISKAHLARGVGVSRSYITKLEQGKQLPSARMLFKLADYFGCQVEDLFDQPPQETRSR